MTLTRRNPPLRSFTVRARFALTLRSSWSGWPDDASTIRRSYTSSSGSALHVDNPDDRSPIVRSSVRLLAGTHSSISSRLRRRGSPRATTRAGCAPRPWRHRRRDWSGGKDDDRTAWSPGSTLADERGVGKGPPSIASHPIPTRRRARRSRPTRRRARSSRARCQTRCWAPRRAPTARSSRPVSKRRHPIPTYRPGSPVPAAEDDDLAAPAVVAHRVMVAFGGSRLGGLGPSLAVKLPRVVEEPAFRWRRHVRIAAEQHHPLPARVVRQAVTRPRDRTRRAQELPDDAVPRPCFAQHLPARLIEYPEADDPMAVAVVDQ